MTQLIRLAKSSELLAAAAGIVWLLTYQLWWIIECPRIYEIGTALTILFLILAIHISAIKPFSIFSLAFVVIAFSNLADEIFFDPTSFDINEYIAAAIIFVIVIFRLCRTKTYQKLS